MNNGLISVRGNAAPITGRSEKQREMVIRVTDNKTAGSLGLQVKRVCTGCIQESVLRSRVRVGGQKVKCSYCGRHRQTFSLSELSLEIDKAFDQYYVKVSDDDDGFGVFAQFGYVDDDGIPVIDAIGEAAGVSEAIASDIQRILEARYQSRSAYEIGEETPYAGSSRYQRMRPDDAGMRRDWDAFERELKHHGRFFNRRGAALLASVFQNIDRVPVKAGRQLVVGAGPGMELHRLFRARVFQSDSALLDALKSPEVQLAAPPSRLASAGRMNARGISVFYGADSLDGAVAEVRPPVGSKVAVAAFEIVQYVTLLDLTALSHIDHVPGSIFDPSTKERSERIVFLQSLGDRMTKPVMPDEQETEYLVTQAVADFLATENTPRFDGIVFESVQTPGSRNVVLFNHTASTEVPWRPEGAKVTASPWMHAGGDPETSYFVLDRWPKEISTSDTLKSNHSEQNFPEPTLRLDRDTITVQHVQSVSYVMESHQVEIHQTIMGDDEF